MKPLIAMMLAVTCAVCVAQQPQRPRAVQMSPKQAKEALAKLEAREKWLAEVRAKYHDKQWFYDAMDRYAKTGIKPKPKVPPGIRVEFYQHPSRERLVRYCTGISGMRHEMEIVETRRGFMCGVMWLDEKVVPWDEVKVGR